VKRYVFPTVIGLVLLLGGIAIGQEKEAASRSATPAGAAVAAKLSTAELKGQVYGLTLNKDGGAAEAKKLSGVGIDASDLYSRGAEPEVSPDVLGDILRKYFAMSAIADTAPQASQAANETLVRIESLQVAQNAKIISLLEKIAAKK